MRVSFLPNNRNRLYVRIFMVFPFFAQNVNESPIHRGPFLHPFQLRSRHNFLHLGQGCRPFRFRPLLFSQLFTSLLDFGPRRCFWQPDPGQLLVRFQRLSVTVVRDQLYHLLLDLFTPALTIDPQLLVQGEKALADNVHNGDRIVPLQFRLDS